jgi:hypothetical protein
MYIVVNNRKSAVNRISAEQQTHFKEQNKVNHSESKIPRKIKGLLGLFCVDFEKKDLQY